MRPPLSARNIKFKCAAKRALPRHRQAAIPYDPDEIHGNDLQTKRYVKRGSVLDLVPLQVLAGDLWE